MDPWGRPITPRRTVSSSAGVSGVREAIVAQLRDIKAWNGNGVGLLSVMPIVTPTAGYFAYEAEGHVMFMSAMWALVRDGIIVPGQPARMYGTDYTGIELFSFSSFTVTPLGRKYLESVDVVHPLEADAYMRDARARLGDADEVVFTYLNEARQSYEDANYLSAIVMLGVSTEMLMKWLIRRFIQHIPEPKRIDVEKVRTSLWVRTDKLFNTFINLIREHFKPDCFPRDLELQVNAHLDQMQTLIRVNRDDVGHGRTERADPQLVAGSLQIYLPLLSIVKELAEAFESRACRFYE